MVENADFLEQSYQEYAQRLPFYEKCDAYAHGSSPEYFSDPRMRSFLRLNTDLMYGMNFAKVPLNVIANRLNVSSFSVPGQNEPTKRLADLWRENYLALYVDSFIFDLLKYATNYASVWESDNPERIGKATIAFESPLTTRVFLREGSSKPTHALKSWKDTLDGQKIFRVNLYFDTHIEKYWAPRTDAAATGIQWREYDFEDGDYVIDNPFGFVPIEPFHTRWPEGEPEHLAAWGIQNAINKLVETHMDVIDQHHLPIRVALYDMLSPEGTSDLSALEGGPQQSSSTGAPSVLPRMRPGDVVGLRAKGIDQWNAADSAQFLDPMKFLISQLPALTDIPLKHFIEPGQQPAQGSLEAADAPLRQRITARENSIGYSFAELMRKALLVEGIKVDYVETHWQPHEIQLSKDAWESAQIQINLGLPPYWVFKQLGIPEQSLQSMGLSQTDKWAPPSATQPAVDGLAE